MIVNVQFAEGHREQIRIERPPDNVSSYYTDQVVAFRRDYAGAARRFARELQNIKSEVQADKPLQRRGRFDRRRMKQAVKGDDRVYYRRGLDLDQDIAVSIQVDRSDSMRTGGLIKDAVKAATITAMALEQSEIPYEMRSFRGKGKGHQVLHKDFGSPRATDEALGAMLVVNGWTPMKRAAEITRAAMSVREERVKLVFILADGSPNCYADGKSYTEHVRETFDAMEEMGMTPVLVYTDSEDLSSEQHELLDNTAGQGRWEHIRNPSALHRVVSNRIRDIYRNAERNR
jgi:nitric oxide reductase activation protein